MRKGAVASSLPIPVGVLGQRMSAEPRRVPLGVRVHRRLRRYYAQLVICALGFGLMGGLVGYRYGPLRYEAEAVMHFRALGPGTLSGADGGSIEPGRVASVLEGYAGALLQPVAGEPEGLVWRVGRSEASSGTLRLVGGSDEAAEASAAVNDLVRAFRGTEPGAAWAAGTAGLRSKRRAAAELAEGLARAEDGVDRRRVEHGAVSLDGQVLTLERRVLDRTRAVEAIEADLETFLGGRGVVRPGSPEADGVLDRLALRDPVLRERLERWRTVRMGLTQAAAIRPAFEAWLLDRGYRQPLRELDGMVQDVLADTRLIDGEPVRRSELRRRRLVVQGELEAAEAALGARLADRAALRAAEARVTAMRRELAALETEIAAAAAVLPVSARLVEPIQWATPPTRPVMDTRRWFAAMGAVVAAGLGVLTLLPLAYRDRLLRRPDEAVLRDAAAPLLAALPSLKSVASGQAPQIGGGAKALPPPPDPAEAAHAAAAIHDLRVLLESNAAPLTDAKTICLASPAAGSGVTSLTLGLSTALAQSGTRTLLVDLAGLASPRLSAAPADPTLDQALTQSRLLDPDEADLLLAPQEQRLGLPAFLDGEPLVGTTLETRLPTLSLLPSLTAKPGDPDRLAGRVLDRLRHEARLAGYDAVLIDAGLVPGRADALLAAAAADATLLVVAPNLDQRRLYHALAQLRLVHAHVLGSVFNRARPSSATTPPPDPQATAAHRPPAAPLRGSGLFAAAMGLSESAMLSPSGFGRHAGSGLLSVSPTSLSGMPYLGDEPEPSSRPQAVSAAPVDAADDPEGQTPDVFAALEPAAEDDAEGPRVLPRPIQVEADPDVDAFVEAMISRAARRPSRQPGKTTHADDPPPGTASDEPAPPTDAARPAAADPPAEPEAGPGRPSLTDRLAAAADELSEPFSPEPHGDGQTPTPNESPAQPEPEARPEDLSDAALERELEAQARADRAAEAQAGEAEARLDAALDDLANEALLLLRSDLAAQRPNPSAKPASSDAGAPPPSASDQPA